MRSLSLLILLLLAMPARADLFTTASTDYGDCVDQGSAFAACSSSVPLDNYTLTGSAYATAAYGRLDAWFFDEVQSGIGPGGSYAVAEFTDTLTVSGGTGVGHIQYFFNYFTYADGGLATPNPCQESGTLAMTSNSQQEGDVFAGLCDVFAGLPHFHDQGYGSFFTDPFNFQFGVPFAIDVTASTGPIAELDSGQGRLTLALDGIRIFDSLGHRIPVRITSQSGTLYPVPEPGSWILLMIVAIPILPRAWIEPNSRDIYTKGR